MPGTGLALLAVGMEDCEPCEIVREQILTLASKYQDVAIRLYKLTKQGQAAGSGQLFGQGVRFFPTVIGLVDGSVAFRIQGARRDAKGSDVALFERGFARFAAERG